MVHGQGLSGGGDLSEYRFIAQDCWALDMCFQKKVYQCNNHMNQTGSNWAITCELNCVYNWPSQGNWRSPARQSECILSWASIKLAWASGILYRTYKGHAWVSGILYYRTYKGHLLSGECSINLVSHTVDLTHVIHVSHDAWSNCQINIDSDVCPVLVQQRANASTTRKPAFLDTPRRPMITHTSDWHQILSQKKTKSKLQILKTCQKLKFWNFARNFTHDTLSEVAW